MTSSYIVQICSIEDRVKLQADIDCFSQWFSVLGLSLNLSGCKVFTFSRIQSPVVFSYCLGEINISRELDSIMDFGFKLSYYLFTYYSAYLHIEFMCCKVFKTLGFVMRLTKDFQLSTSIKVLFCILVRHILEYSCIVWDPYTAIMILGSMKESNGSFAFHQSRTKNFTSAT